MKNNKSLDQMARNLLRCSDRSLQDVINFLDEESKEYLLKKMDLIREKMESKN